ncbi:MAG: ribosomal protein S18-alanine N-acetyltransferase [Alphaproteobacteria bacterium]|nr:ribosomal protein S18-alanine N-acetyltransferase [Alphaproteobacteria bacterium]
MFDEIANLHKLCFPNKPWSAQDFSDLQKSGCEIVASQNGFIVWRKTLDEAEIITIGVNPTERRQGIASAMLCIIENTLKKQQVKKIFLEVSSSNISAQNLYKKTGYKQVGIRPKYYDGIDAILMSKDL